MPAASWLTWLEQTAPAVWARESMWGYPALEVAHILGFTILVGAAVMFDLRLLGFARALPIAATAHHLLRWSRWSLLLVVPSGIALFAANASATWGNAAFQVKLLLLAFAGINALVFHLRSRSTIAQWELHRPLPVSARISAILSLALWTGVITCGRLIAYL
jgi:hypothetical protein